MAIIRVGIVGAGRVGRVHAAIIEQSELAHLVAICDMNPITLDTIGSIYYHAHKYISLIDMLSNENLDCIHIATPHHLHVEMALLALEYSVHIVLEKPIAINSQELNQLINKHKESDYKILVCFQNRMNETTIFSKNKIKEGIIGNLKGVRVVLSWYRGRAYYESSSWRGAWRTEGGGGC